jgi:prepilin-type N-terminal cleavage/methylation domain-containing protein
MEKLGKNKSGYDQSQAGISLPEVLIVLLIISILVVLALPQIQSSRELFRFSGMQREVMTQLREARQQAMSQRKPITFQYNDNIRSAVIYGGSYGNVGDSRNFVYKFDTSGVLKDDIIYGRPVFAPVSALGDGTNLTGLTSGIVEVRFQPDGSVVDASDNPKDITLFFFHKQHQRETAFAVSILGAGGRVKLWRYSPGVNAYVE